MATSVAWGWARAVMHVHLRAVAQKSFEEKHSPLLQLTKGKFVFSREKGKVSFGLLWLRSHIGARWIFPSKHILSREKQNIDRCEDKIDEKNPVFILCILVRPCVLRFRGWILGHRQQGWIGTRLKISRIKCSISLARRPGWIGTVFHVSREKFDIDEKMKKRCDYQRRW